MSEPDFEALQASMWSRLERVLALRIPGPPHGKGSVRVVDTKKKRPRTGKWWLHQRKTKKRGVPDKKSEAYEKKISILARSSYSGPQLDGCLVTRILAVKPRPKTPNSLAQPVDPDMASGRLFCPVKPDWDNIAKSVGDGLNKSKIVKDDARFVHGQVTTLYAAEGESPFVYVELFRFR